MAKTASTLRRIVCGVILMLAVQGAAVAQADPGLYTYVVCANPDTGLGVIAADGVLPAGFTGRFSRTLGPHPSEAHCAPQRITASRGLGISVGVPFVTSTPGDGTGALTFTAPTGVSIVRAVLYRNVATGSASNHLTFSIHSGDPTDFYYPVAVSLCDWASGCVSRGDFSDPWAGANRVDFTNPLPDRLSLTLGCDIPDSTWTCTGSAQSIVRLFGGKLTLRDETSPQQAGAPSGSLVTESVVRGLGEVTVNATDTGSGIYRIRLLVDDVPALTSVVHDNGGKCADVNPANADPYEFADPAPCRSATGGTYSFDTTKLPEGSHNLKVVLEDASGNASTLSNRQVVVDNVPDPTTPPPGGGGGTGSGGTGGTGGSGGPGGAGGTGGTGGSGAGGLGGTGGSGAGGLGGTGGVADRGAPNGSPASDRARLTARWATTSRTTKRSRFGRRHVIRGRLVDERGRGIAGARVELFATLLARGARPHATGGARTRADGSWTLTLPKGSSSRRVELRYRSHVHDAVPAAVARLTLRVSAGLRLAIAPRVARRGTTIRLKGSLRGRPVPTRGKIVELQARTKGRGWMTFRTIRTTRGGRFTSRYRFRRGGPVTYQLRVRARAASDYPFETGTSRPVRVRVR